MRPFWEQPEHKRVKSAHAGRDAEDDAEMVPIASETRAAEIDAVRKNVMMNLAK